MASLNMFHQMYSYFFTILFLVRYCFCVNPKLLNAGFSSAGATFYKGTNTGACGYHGRYNVAITSAGGPSLFKNGTGCGSWKPVTVVITDFCPDDTCKAESTHFDLSEGAFIAMAIPGQEQQLKTVGKLPIQYQQVKCNFPNKIAFKVEDGSNPNFFATLVEYQNIESDIVSVDLQVAGSSDWQPMQRSHRSAVWNLQSLATPLRTPFSLRLRSGDGKTIVAANVIPDGYQPGTPYQSKVNF
ncbi:hypothetical protein MKW94_016439 [Papaver nudicaule]|uniref:Expansin-like EG45 domain-containing protein n=1 Tax=Papaver nudicaule TaxID=74823 RepID=A0AA41V7P3_PAPNU|nr:hypothetical protein [Papaver nudicaule]